MIFDLACIDVCVFLNHRLIGVISLRATIGAT